MPYYVNNNDGGLGQLIGLASGVANFIANQKAQKADAAQRVIENTRNAQNDKIDNAYKQAQTAAATTAAAQSAADRKFESGLQLPKGFGSMTPDQQIGYLNQRLNAAQRAGDQNVIEETQRQISDISLGTNRLANAAFTSGAKTGYENALTANAKGLFQQQLALQDAKGKDAFNRALAVARAHVGRGADPNTAYLNALNAMSRTQYGATVRAALDQFNQEQQDYRAGFNNQGQPTTAAPTFVMPQTQPIIYVMGPNGQPMPVQAPQPAAAKAPAAKAQPKASTPKIVQQSGGNPLMDLIHHLFGGGGGPAPSSAHHLRATSHGQPIHSVDGGKTWLPGP